jgi:hypothetical protein
MKKLIFFSVCVLLVATSCKKNNQVVQKHTCFLRDIGGAPIVGKRVRYFNGQSSYVDFNDPNNLIKELKSDSTGKLAFEGTYNSDLGWVNLVLEPDSNRLALNRVTVSDKVDTIFFDRLVPLKLRITMTFQSYLIAKASLSTSIAPFRTSEELVSWSLKAPLNAPLDTIINTKIPERNSFLVHSLSTTKGSIENYYSFYFYSTTSSSIKNSTLLISF